jgi:uncharacterized membrane protein
MAYTFNTELPSIAKSYSKLTRIKITNSTLEKTIKENPHYPSLLALSETFDRFNVPNKGFKISSEKLYRLNLDVPFIAFVNIPDIGTDFILVTDTTEDCMSYLYRTEKKITLSKIEFTKIFKEVIWVAEPNDISGDRDYDSIYNEEKSIRRRNISLIIASGVSCLLLFSNSIQISHIVQFITISMLKIIGLASTVLLLIYELNKDNAFIKNLCGISNKTDCDVVLNSNAAKIWGISWGEIGFFYFASTTLGLLLPNLTFQIKASWIAVANICVFPYVFFSIYYQWRIVKQWCPLCLTVQFILVSEVLWSSLVVWSKSIPNILIPISFYSILFCFLFPIIVWYALKPIFIKSNNHDLYKTAFKRLQYNPDIFNGLLLQQEQVPNGWQNIGINIGNLKATNTIIKICNPYCNPCNKAHAQLEEIIQKNTNVNLKIIFVTHNKESDSGRNVVKHLLSLASEKDVQEMGQVLDDWYLNVNKDYKVFCEKYPVNGDFNEQEMKITEMRSWCDNAHITHTPTIFVNGYMLPENYKIEELKYIL